MFIFVKESWLGILALSCVFVWSSISGPDSPLMEEKATDEDEDLGMRLAQNAEQI